MSSNFERNEYRKRYSLRRPAELKAPKRYGHDEVGDTMTNPQAVKNNLDLVNTRKKKPKIHKKNKKIAIDFGTVTPERASTKTLKVDLELLPISVTKAIDSGTTRFSIIGNNIVPKQNRGLLLFVLFVLTLAFFLFFFWEGLLQGILNKNIENSSAPLDQPNQYLSTEVITELKSESSSSKLGEHLLKKLNSELKFGALKNSEVKRKLFIEQECSNAYNNDFQYDYALKSNGARILSTLDTEPYGENYIKIKFLGLNLGPLPNFLFPQHASESPGPSVLLENAEIIPGRCWAFKGTRGRIRINLANRILISAVSIAHIAESFTSAPRFFSIMGIDHTDNGQEIRSHLGTFEFEKNGKPIQIFKLASDEATYPYSIIEFQVTANHGNKDFTCVYRLKVYGHV